MDNLTISHLTLRRVIGILALAFPFLLIIGGYFGGNNILHSLSAYYWSNTSVLFTGMLITFGIFLLSYKGYDKQDDLITSISGISMILVSLFPMYHHNSNHYVFAFVSPHIVGYIHYISAMIAFSFLGIMSYFQFTKNNGKITKAKKKRNIVYKTCGIIIELALLIIAFGKLFGLNSIFWFESIIVFAFGVSWLVKGEMIFKDAENSI